MKCEDIFTPEMVAGLKAMYPYAARSCGPTSSYHWERLYVEARDQARHSETALLRFKGQYFVFATRIGAIADALAFWRRCERSLEHLGEGPW